MLKMHQQTSLFPLAEYEPDFTPDCWETPDDIARRMAALVLPSDRLVLEPAAGTGQIAQYLPPGSLCCEIKSNRVQRLKLLAPHCQPIQADFLSLKLGKLPLIESDGQKQGFDLLISNPPFSLCIEFIENGLSLLNKNNPNARILFLLPIDFGCSIKRGTAFQGLDCHIHHIHWVMNRIAYIRDGKPRHGRQIYDAVFDIRPGKQKTSVISFL